MLYEVITPGPSVFHQTLHSGFRDLQSGTGAVFAEEMLYQYRQIVLPFPQRRQTYRNNGQPIIEVFPEGASGNRLFKILRITSYNVCYTKLLRINSERRSENAVL